MKLIIGGCAQGKLAYACLKYHCKEEQVWDGILPDVDAVAGQNQTLVINHFHQWVKSRMAEGKNPKEEIFSFLNHCEDCIIISDEIGNGLVPVDAFERKYRECTGRILIQLAKQAKEVERVICGIGQRIK